MPTDDFIIYKGKKVKLIPNNLTLEEKIKKRNNAEKARLSSKLQPHSSQSQKQISQAESINRFYGKARFKN